MARDGATVLAEKLAEAEEKWLAADAVLWQIVEVVRAARDRQQAGEEAQASILIDAACRIADSFEVE